ncbi:hypothetical protein MTR67_030805, partial [Solanum verrucosum]
GIEVDPKKTHAVKSLPRPLSPSNIRSFLSEAYDKSFEKLKHRLIAALILTLPKRSDGFGVYCYASRIGIGCVLTQNGKVIAYTFRQLKFWKSFQKGLRTRVKLSTTFHPQTNGKVERTIQTLEDMLRAFVIDFKGNCDDHLPLIEFAYNNRYHLSICMAPFEAFYGRRCRSLISLFEVGEVSLIGPELIHETMEKVQLITERMKTSQS